jgi:hypothetical protein
MNSPMTPVCEEPEQLFKKVPVWFRQRLLPTEVDPRTDGAKEEQMKKLTYALAAAATLAIGIPTIANAAGVGVYVGEEPGYYVDRYDGPRVRFYDHDRGWHRGWYRHDRDYDRDFVIRRHYWDD